MALGPKQPDEFEMYGIRFKSTGDPTVDALRANLHCFRTEHPRRLGGEGKYAHFMNIVELLWNNPKLNCQKRYIHNEWAEKFFRKACKERYLGVAGSASAGKCLGLNELVLYHDGSTRKAADVKPGDLLMGDDSQPRKVLEVHRGRGPMYRVVPARGNIWECSGNHILVLKDDAGTVRELSVEDFVRAPYEDKLRWKQFKGGPFAHETPVNIWITPAGEGEWIGFSVDGNHRHLLGDFTVTHNSDPAALWAIVNYLADPTHCKVLVMSTTLAGAKLRIWKTFTEYWAGVPCPPGKPLWSMNMVKGLGYDYKALSDASGIQLLASEKSKERDALERIIGIKAPKTDGPDGREGKLILLIDEMTGASESILHAAYTNLDSSTNFQMIGLGNPNSLFDPFGLFCEPKDGWDSITEEDMEWPTKRGVCIRFDAQYNPRIVNRDETLVWMPTQAKIDQARETYGEKSLFFNRMFRAIFTKEGSGASIYSAADFISAKAFDNVVWGYEEPENVAFLDPSFTEGGDRCILSFGRYGIDSTGLPVLEFTDYEALHVNLSSQEVPHNYQIARQFRDACQRRGVLPRNAGFDSTGAGGPFGDIVAQEWSPEVHRVNFSGSPSNKPVSNSNKTSSKEFYANRVSELWYAAKPLLAAGQIKGITNELAKEICVRENFKSPRGEDTRKLKVESKKDLRLRTNESPDLSDAFFGLIEICRNRFGFKRSLNKTMALSAFSDPGDPVQRAIPDTGWSAFRRRHKVLPKKLH